MNGWPAFVTIVGLALITLFTRTFFLLFERELALPAWVQRGLRYAPLAALAAVLMPEIAISHGHLIDTWKDARLYAVATATLYYVWRRGLLGTILAGMAVLVPLKLFLSW